MAFSINDIRSRLNPARPTLFNVIVNFPGSGIAGALPQKFTFTCNATSIPPMVVGQIEVPYFGRMMKVPGDRTFGNWSVRVYNDEDYAVREAFERWNNAINTIEGNVSLSNDPQGLKSATAIISHLPKDGKGNIKQYTIKNLFPIVVSEMELSWEAQNQIQSFSVEFAYDEFVPGLATASPSSTS